MFGMNLWTLLIGVLVGLVLVQLYPPSAKVGAWVVARIRQGIALIRK